MLETLSTSVIFALFLLSKSSVIKTHDHKNTTLSEKKKDILKAWELNVLQKLVFNILIFKPLATGKKSRLPKIVRLEFKLTFGTAKIAPFESGTVACHDSM